MKYSIGEFANIARVSVKALRYYDKINLFSPSNIDEMTGYRYYREDQITEILLIKELSVFGFSLKEIGQIMDNQSPPTLITALNHRKSELDLEIKNLNRINAQINSKIEDIKAKNSTYPLLNRMNFAIREIKEKFVYSKRRIIDLMEEPAFCMECEQDLKAMGLEAREPYIGIYYYENMEIDDFSHLDTEICLSVERRKFMLEDNRFKTILGGKYVTAIHVGDCYGPDYNDELEETYSEMIRWINTQNYKITGIPAELHLKNSYDPDDPENCITEICIPIESV
ncbi:MerR family transcriptional regulator [Anaerovorax odorimutans]|uniref:MerR family transcriptional regulator n=2 Tax=Anaerovorax odorimutans TaxID=109327 RepID=A0ABT1RQW6_9FIRM|nr:MerR family transcriptional regulator [Anaerovorax odorimutans]